MKESTYLRIEVQAISNDEMPCNVHITLHSKHYFYSMYLFDLPSILQVENIFSKFGLQVERDSILFNIPRVGNGYTLEFIKDSVGGMMAECKDLDMFFVLSRPVACFPRTDFESYLMSLMSAKQEKDFLKYPTRKPVQSDSLPY